MEGQRNLPALNAPLKISLSEIKCSHSLYLPHALSPYACAAHSCGGRYPNGGTAKPASTAREAFLYTNDGAAKSSDFGTQSRKSVCQKANALPFSARRFSSPDWQDSQICQFCTRSRKSVWQKAHARTASAHRWHFLSALSHPNHI